MQGDKENKDMIEVKIKIMDTNINIKVEKNISSEGGYTEHELTVTMMLIKTINQLMKAIEENKKP
jgi:hypothetical protein